jgi:hypothetical protein
MEAAYDALEMGEYAALPAVIDRLDAAFVSYPEQGRLPFYAGTMRLWRATGAPRDLAGLLADVRAAISNLEQARALRPNDPHVNAFLGIAQVSLGTGLAEADRVETGRSVLAHGVQFYPPYVNGVRTQALMLLPRDHAYFPEALEAMYDTFEGCGFDSSGEDSLSPEYPTRGLMPTCWNGGVVDHVWEGIFLIYGDLFVKRGDPAGARKLYETAKKSPTYDNWLFQAELEERIARADEHAARYIDSDASNDPSNWVQSQHLCVGCHASKQ